MRHNVEKIKNLARIFNKYIVFVVIVSCLLFLNGSFDAVYGKSGDKKGSSPIVKTEQKEQQADQSPENENVQGIMDKDYKEDDFRPQVEEESYAWLVFKTMMIMGLLIGGFYYFFRYVTKKTGMQLMGQGVINVLSVVPIGQNKFLQIIDLAGKVIVLGVSDNNINLITEITDKDEISRIRIQSQKNPVPGAGGFQEHLSRNIGKIFDRVSEIKNRKKGSKDSFHFESEQGYDVLREHQNRLKKLNGHDE